MPRRWYEFGPYRMDPDVGLVLRRNSALHLTPKAVETLRVLIENAGRVVLKATLLAEVWPGSFVEEGSLARNISDLRKVLSAGDRSPGYIETLPKRGYRFAAPVREVRLSEEPSGRTVAVLPFRRLGERGRTSRTGLGIAEALIARLSAVRGCVVRPVTGGLEHKRSLNPIEIGRRLNAELVVDGTVQHSAHRTRVIAKVFDATKGALCWGEMLEERRSDTLACKVSIAEQLAGAIAIWLGTESRKGLSWTRRTSGSRDAYRLYLRGRFEWGKRSAGGLRKAISWFRLATAEDPEYALAYSGLAASYALLPMLAPLPTRKFMPRARAAATNALDIDESLTEARSALAFVKWHYDWDWAGAGREFRQIRRFHGGDALTSQWFGLLLAEQGRFTEAVTEAKRARRLDPRSASTRANVATVLFFAGRRDEAVEEARQALALSADSVRAHLIIGMAFEQAKMLDDAITELERAWRLGKRYPGVLGALAHAYALAGRAAEFRLLLRRLESLSEGHVWSYARALAYIGGGRLEEGLRWLERACSERDFMVVQLKVDRRLDAFRGIPRFHSLLAQVGLSI